LEFWTKVANIGGMPALVAISGLVLAVIKARRRAPRATSVSSRPRTIQNTHEISTTRNHRREEADLIQRL
jgi:hypothetical protein